MKSLILAILLLTSFSTSSATTKATTYAWDAACFYGTMSCEGLAPPHIGYGELLETYGARGIYSYAFDPDMVWLDVSLWPYLSDDDHIGVLALSILIHEMVHYIDAQTNGYTGSDAAACTAEGIAWSAANRWLTANDSGDLASWNWRDYYMGCEA